MSRFPAPFRSRLGLAAWIAALCAAALLAACSTPPVSAPPETVAPQPGATALPPPIPHAKSRWVPVDWAELPGFEQDEITQAWSAWIRSCERTDSPLAALCSEVRRLSLATPEEQRDWMRARLQPYRVEPLDGAPGAGLLTGYFEPVVEAMRQPQGAYTVPVYRPPATLGQRRPWYTRQESDTLPEARAQLQGQEIAWLDDPLDALILQIQGSGRARITEPDGSQRLVRLSYAASNGQPYRSVGKWLLDQGLRDSTWPGIKAWASANPQRMQELLWSNPRIVFFREEPLQEWDAALGPRGAQGVQLTPGRSIAIDPQSIPYGTPVWLSSPGPLMALDRLVLAQDTGSAITGALRADYFVGWGPQAGDLAGRLKQPLKLWVLWPKSP